MREEDETALVILFMRLSSSCRDLIEKGGGVLLDPGENDEGAGLLLVDKDEMGEGRSLRPEKDMFDCSLIRDCVNANDLVHNMLEYR